MEKCVLVILDNDFPFTQQMIITVGCALRILQMSSSHLLVSSSETLLPVIICFLEVQCRRLLFLHFVFYSDNSETSRLVQGQTQIILKSILCILFSSLSPFLRFFALRYFGDVTKKRIDLLDLATLDAESACSTDPKAICKIFTAAG